MDYASLVNALQEASTSRSPERLREAYEVLLREYPHCNGYWKQLADFEVKEGNAKRANEVYERALVMGCYSVDLWAFYGMHATANWQCPEDVRVLFERGARFVGSDYGADVFWDRYIAFETARADANHSRRVVSHVYRRALQQPLRSLDALWLRFQQLAVESSCAEVLDDNEEVALQQTLEAAGLPPHRRNSAEAEDDGARKLRLLPLLENQFRRAKADHSERLQWEGGVCRRHFHVRSARDEELEHWHNYLDWEERHGDVPRLILTYERCLVPCCLEPGMWRRYINVLEGREMVAEARNAFSRASGSFLKHHSSFLLEHAAFEEAHRSVSKARHLCVACTSLQPPVLEAFLAQVNLEVGAICSKPLICCFLLLPSRTRRDDCFHPCAHAEAPG